jgi:hypothetical protein
MRHPSSPLAWVIKRQGDMATDLFRINSTTYCLRVDFKVMEGWKQIFLTIFFVFSGAFHFSAHAETRQFATQVSEDMLKICKTSATLCKKEDLIPKHLDELNWHVSEEMLKRCKISALICKKENLNPEHLAELAGAK